MKYNFFFDNFYVYKRLPGVAGFEPANGGVKVHSLTTWRHPRDFELDSLIQSKKFQYWARRDSNP